MMANGFIAVSSISVLYSPWRLSFTANHADGCDWSGAMCRQHRRQPMGGYAESSAFWPFQFTWLLGLVACIDVCMDVWDTHVCV
ncbi:hypothetical protein J3E74DRAFT_314256, partial [Bipolaris maydis]